MNLSSRVLIVLFPFLLVSYAFAGKKVLYFDDAETVGKGKYQMENYLSYLRNKRDAEGSYIFNFTYGLGERTDAALNIPIGYLRSHGNINFDISDPSFEIKHKFYEKEKASLAIKPYISIPVKKESPFSEGRITYGITLISQWEGDKFTLYSNSSYMVHGNNPLKDGEFFQSLSLEYPIRESLSLISTVYLSFNDRREFGAIAGIGYSKGNIEIGLGVGKNFHSSNVFSVYGGLTYKFFLP